MRLHLGAARGEDPMIPGLVRWECPPCAIPKLAGNGRDRAQVVGIEITQRGRKARMIVGWVEREYSPVRTIVVRGHPARLAQGDMSGSVQVLCRFCAGFWTPAMMRCLALGRPASKKRQGTKSREVWRRRCRERYGDLIFAPAVMVGAMRASGDLHGCAQGSLEACSGYLGRGVDRIDWRSAG
jgi:hypothetical protein